MAEGFIDGDLVEQFLELPESQMAEICQGLKVSVGYSDGSSISKIQFV